jgi:ABC-2 type transport system permease protein
MHSALLVARREYVERVRSTAFRISTVLIPMILAGVLAVGVFSAKHLGGGGHLVIACNDVRLANGVRAELLQGRNPPSEVEVQSPATRRDIDSLIQRVDQKQVDAYVWVQTQAGVPRPSIIYATRSSTDLSDDHIRDAVGNALLRERLQAHGLQPEEINDLLKDLSLQRVQVKDGAAVESNGQKRFWAAYCMMFLLYFSVIFYGLNVGRSVVEEKTSRIFEVLLSSVKAESLMIGKLLGVGGAALTQLGIWFGLLLIYSSSRIAAQVGIYGFASLGIPAVQIVFFLLYFVLGFLFYSAISAGLGAAMSTEQEMNQFQMVITLPMIISFTLFSYVLANPSSPLSVGLSLFPPCAPLIMCLRMGIQMPPLWQPVLSVTLMVFSIYLIVWIASRIYRIGILMYGKRANLPEMIRWMRYS